MPEVGKDDGQESPDIMYRSVGVNIFENGDVGEHDKLNESMIRAVAVSLADTAFYIAGIREKLKLQTRKNYMKGTYDLMLYVINEFLVDYSRLNPMFRSQDLAASDASGKTYSVGQILGSVFADLSSHDINSLTAIEYFDSTEYYNIRTNTDGRSNLKGTNGRFWENPGGEQLTLHDGVDPDFDAKSITSFYMDTLGIRDNYISDENSLCAFLDAVFSLGAVDSFVHKVYADKDGAPISSGQDLFGAQVEKYGRYSDDLYRDYQNLNRVWALFTSYLSGESYDYQVSDCVSAQALSVAGHIRQNLLDAGLSSVSSVYDRYIDRVDQLSLLVDQGVDAYNSLISGEYSFYFQRADGYKYCFEDQDMEDPSKYKHEYYVGSSWDAGLEYWYDMLQRVGEYAAGEDETRGGAYITNWPIRDTVEYFYAKFSQLS